MYTTSPAFSFKGKYNKIQKDTKPSPLQYNVQNWNPKKTPSWKFSSDIKCKHDISLNPGPGQYQRIWPERSNKFGIIGKQNYRAKINTQKSPSPSEYSPKLLGKGPSMSFAKKYEVSNKEKDNPGPATYQRTITIKTQNSVIGKQKRFIDEKEPKLIPGPGTYQYKRPSSAKISFGKQQRDCGKKLNTTADPGPGQYEKVGLFDDSNKSSKGFSIGHKIFINDLEGKPGPGNYDPNFSKFYTTTPSFSIPRKYKPVNPDPVPAPNNYDPKILHQSMHIIFNKDQRKPFLNNKETPGPGRYQPQKILKTSPKFSLGISRKNDVCEDFPGPGAYEPNKNVTKTRPQSAKIGKGNRYKQNRQLSPGPGQYGNNNRKQRPTTPAYGFGKDSRMKRRMITSPGPGEYEIPTTVGYVAPYAFK